MAATQRFHDRSDFFGAHALHEHLANTFVQLSLSPAIAFKQLALKSLTGARHRQAFKFTQ
jgi:hypothetical protein